MTSQGRKCDKNQLNFTVSPGTENCSRKYIRSHTHTHTHTLHPSMLLDKLKLVGISGRSNSWFESYLVGGEQQVDWEGERSKFARVLFGVRQGSILGPILFLLHTADMASAVGTAFNVTYADDSTIWCYANTADELKIKLEDLAARFSAWAVGNGLVMNAGKTQLIV
jgi:hypothetical protein